MYTYILVNYIILELVKLGKVFLMYILILSHELNWRINQITLILINFYSFLYKNFIPTINDSNDLNRILSKIHVYSMKIISQSLRKSEKEKIKFLVKNTTIFAERLINRSCTRPKFLDQEDRFNQKKLTWALQNANVAPK